MYILFSVVFAGKLVSSVIKKLGYTGKCIFSLLCMWSLLVDWFVSLSQFILVMPVRLRLVLLISSL